MEKLCKFVVKFICFLICCQSVFAGEEKNNGIPGSNERPALLRPKNLVFMRDRSKREELLFEAIRKRDLGIGSVRLNDFDDMIDEVIDSLNIENSLNTTWRRVPSQRLNVQERATHIAAVAQAFAGDDLDSNVFSQYGTPKRTTSTSGFVANLRRGAAHSDAEKQFGSQVEQANADGLDDYSLCDDQSESEG